MGSINKLSTINSVIVPINKTMDKIKINFFITPKIGEENISARFTIHDINSNKIYVKYYQKTDEMSIKNIEGGLNTVNNISANLETIDENKSNISTNLININTNEDNIAYNSSEINYIKNNISKPYLKNVYNFLFYNIKIQIDFRGTFFEKVFDVNASINDFIEMNFKIDLEYEHISERNYVKTIYEIFDETNNTLYVKSVTNDDYTYFSNRVIIDENIFYNFIKDIKKIKFAIKFQMLLSRVIKIWYIKNDNYRLVIKNYGL